MNVIQKHNLIKMINSDAIREMVYKNKSVLNTSCLAINDGDITISIQNIGNNAVVDVRIGNEIIRKFYSEVMTPDLIIEDLQSAVTAFEVKTKQDALREFDEGKITSFKALNKRYKGD